MDWSRKNIIRPHTNTPAEPNPFSFTRNYNNDFNQSREIIHTGDKSSTQQSINQTRDNPFLRRTARSTNEPNLSITAQPSGITGATNSRSIFLKPLSSSALPSSRSNDDFDNLRKRSLVRLSQILPEYLRQKVEWTPEQISHLKCLRSDVVELSLLPSNITSEHEHRPIWNHLNGCIDQLVALNQTLRNVANVGPIPQMNDRKIVIQDVVSHLQSLEKKLISQGIKFTEEKPSGIDQLHDLRHRNFDNINKDEQRPSIYNKTESNFEIGSSSSSSRPLSQDRQLASGSSFMNFEREFHQPVSRKSDWDDTPNWSSNQAVHPRSPPQQTRRTTSRFEEIKTDNSFRSSSRSDNSISRAFDNFGKQKFTTERYDSTGRRTIMEEHRTTREEQSINNSYYYEPEDMRNVHIGDSRRSNVKLYENENRRDLSSRDDDFQSTSSSRQIEQRHGFSSERSQVPSASQQRQQLDFRYGGRADNYNNQTRKRDNLRDSDFYPDNFQNVSRNVAEFRENKIRPPNSELVSADDNDDTRRVFIKSFGDDRRPPPPQHHYNELDNIRSERKSFHFNDDRSLTASQYHPDYDSRLATNSQSFGGNGQPLYGTVLPSSYPAPNVQENVQVVPTSEYWQRPEPPRMDESHAQPVWQFGSGSNVVALTTTTTNKQQHAVPNVASTLSEPSPQLTIFEFEIVEKRLKLMEHYRNQARKDLKLLSHVESSLRSANAGDVKHLIKDNKLIEKEIRKAEQNLSQEIKKLSQIVTKYNKIFNPSVLIYKDGGDHWCPECDVISPTINDALKHLITADHKSRVKSVPNYFKDFTSWQKRQICVGPAHGIEFLYYCDRMLCCTLCEKVFGDEEHALNHLQSITHNCVYKTWSSKRETYDEELLKGKTGCLQKIALQKQKAKQEKFLEQQLKLREQREKVENSKKKPLIGDIWKEVDDADAAANKKTTSKEDSDIEITKLFIPASLNNRNRNKTDQTSKRAPLIPQQSSAVCKPDDIKRKYEEIANSSSDKSRPSKAAKTEEVVVDMFSVDDEDKATSTTTTKQAPLLPAVNQPSSVLLGGSKDESNQEDKTTTKQAPLLQGNLPARTVCKPDDVKRKYDQIANKRTPLQSSVDNNNSTTTSTIISSTDKIIVSSSKQAPLITSTVVVNEDKDDDTFPTDLIDLCVVDEDPPVKRKLPPLLLADSSPDIEQASVKAQSDSKVKNVPLLDANIGRGDSSAMSHQQQQPNVPVQTNFSQQSETAAETTTKVSSTTSSLDHINKGKLPPPVKILPRKLRKK